MRCQDWSAPAELPVIAFRCHDPSTAALSAASIVVNEDRGLSWYNHYHLIPFGTDLRYTWEGLTEDILEKLSLCFHLAYSGVSPGQRDEQYRSAMRDYALRCYNRDSSMSAALSLPYRLLQFHYRQADDLFPDYWDITNGGYFFSRDRMEAYAARLKQAPKEMTEDAPCAETELMAQWEHERWSRYVLSRGWLSATPEQVEGCCKAGNPRQQLYIARMHPCITPYWKLDKLEKYLRDSIGMKKNFRQMDITSIQKTEDILRLLWLDA